MPPIPRFLTVLTAVLAGSTLAWALVPAFHPGATSDAAAYVPDLASIRRATPSELRDTVERYSADRAALGRVHTAELSPFRRERFKAFYTAWQDRLKDVDFEPLTQQARIDYLLLGNQIRYELSVIKRDEKIMSETALLVPFADAITGLHDARRRLESIDQAAAAATIDALVKRVDETRKAVQAGLDDKSEAGSASGASGAAGSEGPASGSRNSRDNAARRSAPPASAQATAGKPPAKAADKTDAGNPAPIKPIKTTKIVAFRATGMVNDLKRTTGDWFKYYDGYDPLFSWWVAEPYRKLDKALGDYGKFLREKVVGVKEGEDEPIIGDPIGRDGVLEDLNREMIPYSPEELLAIANREFAWCEAELKRAARDMGFGDDWHAALEKVKTLHVEPGKQPDLIRTLALEAVDFVEQRDLVTVPPLAKDIWRMEMMTPERQKTSPFFLGGETILVSYPTDTMGHEDKLMSMRGNNIHFSRATVHHELIPGHHLQGFMTARYNPHRSAFGTPFWGEGWALYWEMLLWDLGFPTTPEDRMGMLFWRTHRAARIVFSLSFHMGKMTPQECIDMLVNRVGHERSTAEAEVRRSFNGSYASLYQAAYMLGGLQFRALHEELVKSGKMTNRDFHDVVLKGGRMPVEMVRAALTGAPLSRDFTPRWKFAGALAQ